MSPFEVTAYSTIRHPLFIQFHEYVPGDSLYLITGNGTMIFSDSTSSSDLSVYLPDSGHYLDTFWIAWNAPLRGWQSDTLIFWSDSSMSYSLVIAGRTRFIEEQDNLWTGDSTPFAYQNIAYEISPLYQNQNNGSTSLLSTAVSSSTYPGASGGGNGAMAVKSGNFDPNQSSYFSWTIYPMPPYQIVLDSLQFGVRATATGPLSWTLLIITASQTDSLASGSIQNNSSWQQIQQSLAFDALNDSVELRLYFYGNNGSPAANIANCRIDDILLTVRSQIPSSVALRRSKGSGSWSDTSLWEYQYYDTVYKACSSLPDSTHTVRVRPTDSLFLSEKQTIGPLQLEGKLALNGQSLTMLNSLTGQGVLCGNEASELFIQGNTDSVEIRFHPLYRRIKRLHLDKSQGMLLLKDTLEILEQL
ncbi:MAG: hypothetical protein LPK45_10770, partial [Bacteroidota bacterium]|nr:hypothetical protein [Bacteroidota bacterium]MDX5431583.1 hypothetical protein [Bacteroidota bacterium]MDX5470303.1 hypothetical protein [Bacteroidota bacterium]